MLIPGGRKTSSRGVERHLSHRNRLKHKLHTFAFWQQLITSMKAYFYEVLLPASVMLTKEENG